MTEGKGFVVCRECDAICCSRWNVWWLVEKVFVYISVVLSSKEYSMTRFQLKIFKIC